MRKTWSIEKKVKKENHTINLKKKQNKKRNRQDRKRDKDTEFRDSQAQTLVTEAIQIDSRL